jgi:hypothetical protein
MRAPDPHRLEATLVGDAERVLDALASWRGNGAPEWAGGALPILDADARLAAAAAPLALPLDPTRLLAPPGDVLGDPDPVAAARWRRHAWGDDAGIVAEEDWTLEEPEPGRLRARIVLLSPERALRGIAAALQGAPGLVVETALRRPDGRRIPTGPAQAPEPPAEEPAGPWRRRRGRGLTELRLWTSAPGRPRLAVVAGVLRVDPDALRDALEPDPDRLGWRLAVRRLDRGTLLFEGSYASEGAARMAGTAVAALCAGVLEPRIPVEFGGGQAGRRRSHADFLLAGGDPADLAPGDRIAARALIDAERCGGP